jgi:hypothetical protein
VCTKCKSFSLGSHLTKPCLLPATLPNISSIFMPHSSLFTTSHPTNEWLFLATFLAKMGSKPTQYDIGTYLDACLPRSGAGLGQKGRIDKKSSSFRQQPNSSRIIRPPPQGLLTTQFSNPIDVSLDLLSLWHQRQQPSSCLRIRRRLTSCRACRATMRQVAPPLARNPSACGRTLRR